MTSAIFCEHANEVPHVCPCPADCYCRIEGCCKTRQGETMTDDEIIASGLLAIRQGILDGNLEAVAKGLEQITGEYVTPPQPPQKPASKLERIRNLTKQKTETKTEPTVTEVLGQEYVEKVVETKDGKKLTIIESPLIEEEAKHNKKLARVKVPKPRKQPPKDNSDDPNASYRYSDKNVRPSQLQDS